MGIQELREIAYSQIKPKIRGNDTTIFNFLPNLKITYRPQQSIFERMIYEPLVCLILRGTKETIWDRKTLRIEAGEGLYICHDLPLMSRVLEYPYMSLVFSVDINLLRNCYEDVKDITNSSLKTETVEAHTMDDQLLNALQRYLMLGESDHELKILGPMILKEVHYRLLTASFGAMFRKLISLNSNASTISRAIAFIRQNFNTQIIFPQLAESLGMSSTSFNRHFKKTTALSPLQYQKEIRLITARNQLVSNAETVTEVAYNVGYESPNQFSREYSRKFGVAPREDFYRKVKKRSSECSNLSTFSPDSGAR